MKKPNRQTLLVTGAVICLLISVFALLPSGSGSGGDEPAPSENTAATPPTEPSDGSAGVEADSGVGAGLEPAPTALNPDFYQRVRQQLLAVVPEHQEPFVAESSPPPSMGKVGGETLPLKGEVSKGTPSLPVLPLTLQPTQSAQELGQTQRSAPTDAPTDTANPQQTSPPSARFRGRIHNHAKGRIIVLFELNGALLRASNEPNAEWRILRITPRQITVRNGEQTLILEVPYAH